jgi:hypothetical protein
MIKSQTSGAVIATRRGSNPAECAAGLLRRCASRNDVLMIGAALLCLIAFPAMAATYTTKGVGDCANVTRYQQADGVEYEPGTDAKGWAVAPADINPPALTADDFSDVDIGLNIPVDPYLKDDTYNYDDKRSDIQLGTINVQRDGQTSVNGKRIDSDDGLLHPDCQ